jgi:hypothetical protein
MAGRDYSIDLSIHRQTTMTGILMNADSIFGRIGSD